MMSSIKSSLNAHSVHGYRFIEGIIILNKRGREMALRGFWKIKVNTRHERNRRFKSFRKKKRTTKWASIGKAS